MNLVRAVAAVADGVVDSTRVNSYLCAGRANEGAVLYFGAGGGGRLVGAGVWAVAEVVVEVRVVGVGEGAIYGFYLYLW